MKKLFLLLLFLSQVTFALEEVENSYPFFRQFRSGFNITFGTLSLTKSVEILQDKNSNDTEKKLGYLLTAIGLMRLSDGLYYMYHPSLPEVYQKEGKLDSAHPSFKENLIEAKNFEKRLRRFRATVIFLNGMGLFGVYNENPDKNQLVLLPAVGMMVVSSYAFWGKAPAEKAYDRLFSRPVVTLNYHHYQNTYTPYPQVSFFF